MENFLYMKRRNKILVIEDHDSIRMLMTNFLSKDFDVVTKSDGFDGLAWLSSGNIPDFILLDYDMPRINGLQFLENIRKSGFFQTIPVIVVTGEEDAQIKEACKKFGITDFLTKPFNPIELRSKIQAVLKHSAPSTP